MACPYAELANKIEIHLKLDETPGYFLSETEQKTIIEALRYASEHTCPDHPDMSRPEP